MTPDDVDVDVEPAPSAQAVLEDLLEGAEEDPALERVLRDARGQPAAPRPLDLVSVLPATDGRLALDVADRTREAVAIRRADPTADRDLPGEYELAVRDGGLTLVAGLEYPQVADVVRRKGADVVLAADRRELFADDQATDHATQSEIWAILFTH